MSGSLTTEQLARVAELERGDLAKLSENEARELHGLRVLARRLIGPAEVADNPATPFVDESRRPMLAGVDNPSTPEDESDYLGAQLARSRQEREAAALKYLKRGLALLEPIAMAALNGLLQRGMSEATKQLPAELAPVLEVVRGAAEDAARAVVGDATPR